MGPSGADAPCRRGPAGSRRIAAPGAGQEAAEVPGSGARDSGLAGQQSSVVPLTLLGADSELSATRPLCPTGPRRRPAPGRLAHRRAALERRGPKSSGSARPELRKIARRSRLRARSRPHGPVGPARSRHQEEVPEPLRHSNCRTWLAWPGAAYIVPAALVFPTRPGGSPATLTRSWSTPGWASPAGAPSPRATARARRGAAGRDRHHAPGGTAPMTLPCHADSRRRHRPGDHRGDREGARRHRACRSTGTSNWREWRRWKPPARRCPMPRSTASGIASSPSRARSPRRWAPDSAR